jgi:hypothetical protein
MGKCTICTISKHSMFAFDNKVAALLYLLAFVVNYYATFQDSTDSTKIMNK